MRAVMAWQAAAAAFLPTPAAAAESEVPPAESPAASLPAAPVSGADFHVVDPVQGDGLMRYSVVQSRFGVLGAYGRLALAGRLREVAALSEASRTTDIAVIAGAVGGSVQGNLRTVAGFASNPLGTAIGIPKGISHLFRGYAARARELSARSGAKAGRQPTEDTAADLGADARRYANRCFGVTARERGWYLQLGADPYTDNELLRRTVHHLAKVDAATRLGLKFAGVPGLPYAGELRRAMDAIDNADPAVRRARRRAVLAGYGLGGQEIHRFDDSLLLSPTRQQLLEDAAASLAEVDGRAELFGHAMTLSSEQAVQVFVHSLLLRARLHAQRPLARILAGPALPAAQLANGGVLVAAAFGAAYWIEPVAGLFATLRAPLPDGAQAPELWVSGEISPPAAAELTALVWSVDGGADSGPERQALP